MKPLAPIVMETFLKAKPLARLTEILTVEDYVPQFLLCNTSFSFQKNYRVC